MPDEISKSIQNTIASKNREREERILADNDVVYSCIMITKDTAEMIDSFAFGAMSVLYYIGVSESIQEQAAEAIRNRLLPCLDTHGNGVEQSIDIVRAVLSEHDLVTDSETFMRFADDARMMVYWDGKKDDKGWASFYRKRHLRNLVSFVSPDRVNEIIDHSYRYLGDYDWSSRIANWCWDNGYYGACEIIVRDPVEDVTKKISEWRLNLQLDNILSRPRSRN